MVSSETVTVSDDFADIMFGETESAVNIRADAADINRLILLISNPP